MIETHRLENIVVFIQTISGFNTISLLCHEHVCLIRLCFERYFSHYRDWMMGEVSLKT